VDGLLNGRLGFAGEESAGSSFARRDGSVWTTDKDGIIAALLAAEITAVCKKDPGELYTEITAELGDSIYRRSQAVATEEQKAALEHITASAIHAVDLAGEKPISITTKAPGDHNPIGGIKVAAPNGWFAARPSGTEAIYKIYAESFSGEKHLALIEAEAQTVANQAFASAAQKQMTPELQEAK
jgi:phosphoglucomutase